MGYQVLKVCASRRFGVDTTAVPDYCIGGWLEGGFLGSSALSVRVSPTPYQHSRATRLAGVEKRSACSWSADLILRAFVVGPGKRAVPTTTGSRFNHRIPALCGDANCENAVCGSPTWHRSFLGGGNLPLGSWGRMATSRAPRSVFHRNCCYVHLLMFNIFHRSCCYVHLLMFNIYDSTYDTPTTPSVRPSDRSTRCRTRRRQISRKERKRATPCSSTSSCTPRYRMSTREGCWYSSSGRWAPTSLVRVAFAVLNKRHNVPLPRVSYLSQRVVLPTRRLSTLSVEPRVRFWMSFGGRSRGPSPARL